MIQQRYQWQLAQTDPDADFMAMAKKQGLDTLTARVAYARGLTSEEALSQFLQKDISQLHDPYLLHDMAKAVERLRRAIETQEQILIYGDYDADGMTSASLVQETLEMLGAQVRVYLPNRFTDGYGPNTSVYKYFIEQEHVDVILTVDNGVAGHEAIAYAQAAGVDVIVTDHHSLPKELPEAFAIVHPEHPEGHYPFPHLAGVGVAFKLACALLEEIPQELLDLVAIGTVADMVSLTDENRLMVAYGLEVLKQTERLGLQELLSQAQVSPSQVTEETIGFTLAPALNALGRLDDPNPAIELLTGFDDLTAQELAKLLLDKNEERKALVQSIQQEALAMVDASRQAQVLAKEGWHPGVLGIVAGRLLEQLGQPVILLAISDGKAKGSARSVPAVDIFQALDAHRELFEAFGGHAGAAGMTLRVDQLPALQDALEAYICDQQIDLSQKPALAVDSTVALSDLSLASLDNLRLLAPFGMDNPKPHLRLTDVTVTQSKTMGKDQSHLKLRLQEGQTAVDLVAFSQGQRALDFAQAQGLEFVVSLSTNHWNGQTSLQLLFDDARVEGVQLYDVRSRRQTPPADVPDLMEAPQATAVVINQLPEDLTPICQALQAYPHEAIYFRNQMTPNYYLTGYGQREQFARLYKTIQRFPEFDVRYKLKELANYLKIDPILLVKMIQIFEELDFVTISDGLMTVNKNAAKRDIAESQIYQDLKALVKVQELMSIGSPKDIYDYLMQPANAKTVSD
ncbi:single-stranded-DNA-specific exonuclease RecJ [Streptococcus sp. DD12]|uniref:single-stranded-DNA-specific exonuclease RecJ n=1 Tax=Streptococcus sp. DD12 TaxID=1777880 RepID=UPI00079681BD|nr:single-stranded-DNA-specific exonuclease RecJ [Streptococcus sp. DD12]KXT76300.1 Single-stranded-DNA-specific exonuclease RecJ [Streptococcus sp. DD12]